MTLMSETMGIYSSINTDFVSVFRNVAPYDCDIKKAVIWTVIWNENDKQITVRINQIGENDMDKKQTEREVMYKMSLKLLDILKRKGLIDDVEYAQIDELNQASFSPQLKEVYV